METDQPKLALHETANGLRDKWLDFFLGCARDVAPRFRIGTPNTKYVPIQTENGRRNPISVWQEPTGVRISFTLEKNSDFETQLGNLKLQCHYEEGPKHLVTFTSESPEGATAEALKVLATASAKRALPSLSDKPKEKLRVDKIRQGSF